MTDRAAKKIASQLFSACYGGGDSSKLDSESQLAETTAQTPRTVMALSCGPAEMLGQSARQRGVALRLFPGDMDLRPGGGFDRWKGLVHDRVQDQRTPAAGGCAISSTSATLGLSPAGSRPLPTGSALLLGRRTPTRRVPRRQERIGAARGWAAARAVHRRGSP